MISVDLDGKTSQVLLEQHNIEIKKLLRCFQLLTALLGLSALSAHSSNIYRFGLGEPEDF